MTRRKARPSLLVGVLAAAGLVVLLWCAWLVVRASLPADAATAAWLLWLVGASALVTLVAYVRELTRHGASVRRGSWKPLPGLVLLWVAGLTALVAFPVVLPDRAAGASQQQLSR